MEYCCYCMHVVVDWLQALVDIVGKIESALPPDRTGKKVFGRGLTVAGSRVKQESALTASDGGVTKPCDGKPFDTMNNIVANLLLNITRSELFHQCRSSYWCDVGINCRRMMVMCYGYCRVLLAQFNPGVSNLFGLQGQMHNFKRISQVGLTNSPPPLTNRPQPLWVHWPGSGPYQK